MDTIQDGHWSRILLLTKLEQFPSQLRAVYWGGSLDGRFSVKSVARFIQDSPLTHLAYKKVWHL